LCFIGPERGRRHRALMRAIGSRSQHIRTRAIDSSPPALGVWIDQRETGDGVNSSLKMPRRFREHDLERWPDPPFNQVPAVGRRISLAHDHVGVNLGPAVLRR